MKITERPLAQRTCGSAAHGLTVRGCATQRVALKRGAEAPGPRNGRASAATASWATRNDRLFWIFSAPKLQASRDSYFGERRAAHGRTSRGDVENRGSRLRCSTQVRRATCAMRRFGCVKRPTWHMPEVWRSAAPKVFVHASNN